MTPVEDRLRGLGDEPFPDAPRDLVPAVLRRARRRARLRTATGGAAAVLGACLVVVGTGALREGGGSALPAVPGPSTPAPSPGDGRADDRWAGASRVNVLLLGTDAGPGRTGARPDSIVVASIEPATGRMLLVSLPRNLQRAPFPAGSRAARAFPDGFVCGGGAGGEPACFLNSLSTWARENADRYYPGDPDPGLTATRDAVQEVTGLRIDEHVRLDMAGFAALVDAVGGVRVSVAERLPIGGSSTDPVATAWIERGKDQLLDGRTALWFARSRWSTDDYDRMARQRCLVAAFAQQLDGGQVARRLPDLAAALRESLDTSIALSDLEAWGDLARRVRAAGEIRSLILRPGVIDPTRPDVDRIRSLVAGGLDPGRPDSPAVVDVRDVC